MKKCTASILFLLVAFSACSKKQEDLPKIDRFVGRLVLVDFDESNFRDFKLGEDLKYIDPKGVEWNAWAGMTTDGASIPQFLWSVVGSPYTGNYRRAAILHDFYYTHIFRKWEAVQNMFYDAMRTDGVSNTKALLMYYAVYRFSHHWKLEEIQTCPPKLECAKPGDLDIDVAIPNISPTDQQKFKDEIVSVRNMIDAGNLGKDDMERVASNQSPLSFNFQHERISDNWADYRQRHIQ